MRALLDRQIDQLKRKQLVLSDDVVRDYDDASTPLIDRAFAQRRAGGSGMLTSAVGPELIDATGRPLRMYMQLSPGYMPMVGPNSGGQLRREGIGGIRGEGGLADVFNSNPGTVSELAFGWKRPGTDADLDYGKQDAVIRQKAADVDYEGLLQATKLKLFEKAGVKPGDLMANAPVGAEEGDFKRALTYMARSGYGAPDLVSGQQYARIGSDGELTPIQMFSTAPELTARLGIDVSNTDVLRAMAKERAQRHLGMITA